MTGLTVFLRLLALLVPSSRRREWRDEWRAELLHLRGAREALGHSKIRIRLAELVALAGALEDATQIRLRARDGSLLLQDLRHAVRGLLRDPGWTFTTVATLGFGIGTTVAVFAVVYGVMLKPLPFADPDRLVTTGGAGQLTYPLYEQWMGQQAVFEHLEVWARSTSAVRLGTTPELMRGTVVSAGLFSVLGVQPQLGRGLLAEDDNDGGPGAVVLSHGLWQERFRADPNILGQSLIIDDHPHSIVGVMPESFSFPSSHTRYWRSLAHITRTPDNWYLNPLARLRPGVGIEDAREHPGNVLQDFNADGEPDGTITPRLVPLRSRFVGDVRLALLLFQGAVAILLLIGCLNVGALVLVRSTRRARETTIRAALGANRSRLIRGSLLETGVLGLAGGTAGVFLAWLTLRLWFASLPISVPLAEMVELDGTILLVAVFLSLLVGGVVGIVPALRATRVSLLPQLGEGGRGTGGRRTQRTNQVLVVVQLALATVLLVGGGLLSTSFLNLWKVDPGFETEGVLRVSIWLPEASYPGFEPKAVFYDRVQEELVTIPGVTHAAICAAAPLSGSWSIHRLWFEGIHDGSEEGFRTESQIVSPGYFATMGIPILSGRPFDRMDRTSDAPLLIINEALANEFFPNGNAVGKRARMSIGVEDHGWFTVIGVVGNVTHRGLDVAHGPQVYPQYSLGTWPWVVDVAVKVEVATATVAPHIRSLVASIDPNIPVPGISTLESARERELAGGLLLARSLTGFAVAALLLAALGVYGVLSYTVSSRTREIGIRLAVGADSRRVIGQVVRRANRIIVVGLGIGLLGAYPFSRLLNSFLFGVDAHDPGVWAAASMTLTFVSLVAAYLPAHRAGKADPCEVLRTD